MAVTQGRQVEPGWLVQLCGPVRRESGGEVFANKECIGPGEVAGNQAVVRLQPLDPGCERRAVVVIAAPSDACGS